MALLLGACVNAGEPAAPPAPDLAGMRALENPAVPRLIQASARVFSGAAPEDEAAFAALADLGVRTIVSVDGATPQVAMARAHGMRTVHVPFGYDGIPQEAAYQIVRVMRETPGAVYFHCHHGQHRGPAAAAIGLQVESGCSAQESTALMRLAETDPHYAGLWRDVAAFVPPAPGIALPELHEVAPVRDLAAGMAQLDRDWDGVKAVREAAWRAPATHPDLEPAHAARIVAETLVALGARAPADLAAQQEFALRLRQAQADARALQEALAADDLAAAESRFTALKRGCVACHDSYRN